ncbi:MAG: hypothetical protein EXS08_06005 [Planctomycetes bacterium]|nr:hypothetical protein [Planctomycetota bacterium]
MPLFTRWSFVCLPLLALSASAAQLEARGLFTRLSDSGPRGVVELVLGAETYARFDAHAARGANGEFLVQPGLRLWTSIALSDRWTAVHHVSIPSALALTGLHLSAQGVVVGAPFGTQLCNALDLVLSPFQ